MPIPHADSAYVPLNKLTQYLLDPQHPVGGSKADWFRGLGYDSADPTVLERDLLTLARSSGDFYEKTSPFGTKYVVSGTITALNGDQVRVTSIWIVEAPSDRDEPDALSALEPRRIDERAVRRRVVNSESPPAAVPALDRERDAERPARGDDEREGSRTVIDERAQATEQLARGIFGFGIRPDDPLVLVAVPSHAAGSVRGRAPLQMGDGSPRSAPSPARLRRRHGQRQLERPASVRT